MWGRKRERERRRTWEESRYRAMECLYLEAICLIDEALMYGTNHHDWLNRVDALRRKRKDQIIREEQTR